MGGLVDWLARRIWWGMLWMMRRPTVRRMQRASLRLVPEQRRERRREGFLRSQMFARRIGLPLVKTLVWILLLALVMGTIMILTTNWIDVINSPMGWE